MGSCSRRRTDSRPSLLGRLSPPAYVVSGGPESITASSTPSAVTSANCHSWLSLPMQLTIGSRQSPSSPHLASRPARSASPPSRPSSDRLEWRYLPSLSQIARFPQVAAITRTPDSIRCSQCLIVRRLLYRLRSRAIAEECRS